MSLGLLLLFVTISSVNLSLGFFLGRMFNGPKVANNDGSAAEGDAVATAAEKPHGEQGHH